MIKKVLSYFIVTLISVPAVPQVVLLKKKRIGKAEYCIITTQTIDCTDHTMAQCLRSAYLVPDAIMCLTREDAWQE